MQTVTSLASWEELRTQSDLGQYQLCWEIKRGDRTIWCRGAIEELYLFLGADGKNLVKVKFTWKALFNPILNAWVLWDDHYHGVYEVASPIDAKFVQYGGGGYIIKTPDWLDVAYLIPPGVGAQLMSDQLYLMTKDVDWDYLSKSS